MLICVVAWACLLVLVFDRFSEDGAKSTIGWVGAFILIYTLSWVINGAIEYDKENPCAQYETRLQYNPSTKTMMNMRVCVIRGEWVDE